MQNFLGAAQRQRFPAFQELMWHVAVDAAARAQVLAALSPSDLRQRSAAVLEARKQGVSAEANQKVSHYFITECPMTKLSGAGCLLFQLHDNRS